MTPAEFLKDLEDRAEGIWTPAEIKELWKMAGYPARNHMSRTVFFYNTECRYAAIHTARYRAIAKMRDRIERVRV